MLNKPVNLASVGEKKRNLAYWWVIKLLSSYYARKKPFITFNLGTLKRVRNYLVKQTNKMVKLYCWDI